MSRYSTPIALGLVLLLAQMPVVGVAASIGKVLPRVGVSSVNGVKLTQETTIFSGDTISTEANGTVLVMLPKGDKIIIGPSSSATMVGGNETLTVILTSGVVRAHANNNGSVAINARGIVVRPTSGKGSFEVGFDGEALLVAAMRGDVQVEGTNTSVVVPMDQAMQFEIKPDATPSRNTSGVHSISPKRMLGIFFILAVGAAVGTGLLIKSLKDDDISDICKDAAIISPSNLPAGCP